MAWETGGGMVVGVIMKFMSQDTTPAVGCWDYSQVILGGLAALCRAHRCPCRSRQFATGGRSESDPRNR